MPTFYEHAREVFNFEMFKFNISFFSNFGAALFCFTNQFGIVTVCKGLKNTSKIGYYTVKYNA